MSIFEGVMKRLADEIAGRVTITQHVAAPHDVCPVCHGHGAVAKDFYPLPEQYYCSTSAMAIVPVNDDHEQCRSCRGKGIV